MHDKLTPIMLYVIMQVLIRVGSERNLMFHSSFMLCEALAFGPTFVTFSFLSVVPLQGQY